MTFHAVLLSSPSPNYSMCEGPTASRAYRRAQHGGLPVRIQITRQHNDNSANIKSGKSSFFLLIKAADDEFHNEEEPWISCSGEMIGQSSTSKSANHHSQSDHSHILQCISLYSATASQYILGHEGDQVEMYGRATSVRVVSEEERIIEYDLIRADVDGSSDGAKATMFRLKFDGLEEFLLMRSALAAVIDLVYREEVAHCVKASDDGKLQNLLSMFPFFRFQFCTFYV